MDEAAIFIIVLRLIVPLLILRFPITGVLASIFVDWRDHDFLGQYENYQIIDKWLDLYYLSICAWVARSWKDNIARRLALGLFAYRLLGVLILSATGAEWIILLFPDLFGFLFIFYAVYVQFSGSKVLFKGWVSTIPVLITIFIPKMIQEYILHIYLPYPQIRPQWIDSMGSMPGELFTAIIALFPLAILSFYIIKERRRQNADN